MCTMCRPAWSPPTASSCSTGSTATPSRPRWRSPIPRMPPRWRSVFCDELLRNGTTTRAGVLRGLSAIGRCAVRRGGAARHAHHRRQGADGPQRAGGAARHRAARLRRLQGADRALARPRRAASTPSRRALPAPARRRSSMPPAPVARASGRAGADPHRGEPARDRMDREAVSRSGRTISTSTIITG